MSQLLVKIPDWYRPNTQCLYCRTKKLLVRMQFMLGGKDLIVLTSIIRVFTAWAQRNRKSPPNLENFKSGVQEQNPCCEAAYEATWRRKSRAFNAIYRPYCGRRGARMQLGIMILPHGLVITGREFLWYVFLWGLAISIIGTFRWLSWFYDKTQEKYDC